jgi:hypothetical protein
MRRMRARRRGEARIPTDPTRTPQACRNARGVERTVAALRGLGRLEELDAALIALARSTAAALDAAPSPYVAAIVARTHLDALRALSGRPVPETDELDEFLRSLRAPSRQ